MSQAQFNDRERHLMIFTGERKKTSKLHKPLMTKTLLMFLTLSVLFLASGPSFAYVNLKKDFIPGQFPTYPKLVLKPGDNVKLIKRGEYLAKVGDCIACHTETKTNAKPFAGGRGLVVPPFGTFFTPNITPDKKYGIGSWTDKQFINAMHHGIGAKGENLYPAFPFMYFNKITTKDLLAIRAYLNHIPAAHQKNKANKLIFPTNVRLLQYGWKILYFYWNEGQFKPNPKKSAAWNRGAYLVKGLGHCSMCHTSQLLGIPNNSDYLGGALLQGYWAPNITSGALKGYSVDQIVQVFKKGMLLGDQGQVLGPMAEANHDSLKYLTDKDLRAIATYLKSVKAVEPEAAKTKQITSSSVRDIYEKSCSACHDDGVLGAPKLGDTAYWELRIKNQGIPLIIKRAIIGYNQMPPKGTCMTCSNAQIRAVVEYMVHRSLTSWAKAPMMIVPTAPGSIPAVHKLSPKVGKAVYHTTCAACHADGKHNAPKFGDKDVWNTLIKHQGIVKVLEFSYRGKGDNHVRGYCTHCTNKEVLAAAKYMLKHSTSKGNYSLW